MSGATPDSSHAMEMVPPPTREAPAAGIVNLTSAQATLASAATKNEWNARISGMSMRGWGCGRSGSQPAEVDSGALQRVKGNRNAVQEKIVLLQGVFHLGLTVGWVLRAGQRRRKLVNEEMKSAARS